MKKKLVIDGMACAHCQKFVHDTLEKLDGVSAAEVDLASKSAVVTLSHEIPDETLMKAVTDAGYTPVSCETL